MSIEPEPAGSGSGVSVQLVIELTDIHLKPIQRWRLDLDHGGLRREQLVVRALVVETSTEVRKREVMPPVPLGLLAGP